MNLQKRADYREAPACVPGLLSRWVMHTRTWDARGQRGLHLRCLVVSLC